jgi:hypothetical protein
MLGFVPLPSLRELDKEKIMRYFINLVLLGLLSIQPVLAAKLYKWVDEEGNMQFSQVPPIQQNTQTVFVNNGPTVKVEAVPKTQKAAKSTKTVTDKKSKPEAQTAAGIHQANCEAVRNNLAILQDNADVALVDEKTQKLKKLDNTQRYAAIKKAKENVRQRCVPFEAK